MATAIIDGITTRYEVRGSGPPLLMYAPGGFNAVVETWSTQGVYAKIKLMDHLPKHYSCIVFDRRECGQSGGRVEHLTWVHYVPQGKGLLDHLGIEHAHIMGGCMGCCPVAAFGVMHPQMTLSMILYWPVGGAKYRLSSHQRFAEHLGFGIYGGIWVGPDSKIPNTDGYRNDVVAALKRLEVPVVRWPGGCFADEYHWREGVGPRDKRPTRVNTHWGGVEETNAFGTHEFMNFAELIGARLFHRIDLADIDKPNRTNPARAAPRSSPGQLAFQYA